MYNYLQHDWKTDFANYIKPFIGEEKHLIWIPAAAWFVLHAFAVWFWTARPQYAAKIRQSLKESDAKKGRARSDAFYEYRVSFDLPVKSVAFIHAIVSSIGAFWGIAHAPAVMDPYDQTYMFRVISGISAGYFFYDFVVSTYDLDPPFIVHGLFSFIVYGHSIYPYYSYYGAMFLLFEVSTIFLHPRWFLINTGNTSTLAFSLSEKLFTATFIGIRLLWGPYMSFLRFQPGCLHAVFSENAKVHSRFAAIIFSLSNIILVMLSVFWIMQLLRSRMRRKNREKSPSKEEPTETTPLVRSPSKSDKGNAKKSQKVE